MRRAGRLGVVLLLLGAFPVVVRAGEDSDKAYREAMSQGRSLNKQGDHAAAIKAFDRALSLRPDDAWALSELGWSAFLKRDLPRAAQATERAVGVASDPQVKAASLYNLGRIEEDRGNKAKAIDAYRRSLELRPNEVVQKRLAVFDPAADALAPQPLRGPFATLEAWCTQMKSEKYPPKRCSVTGERSKGPQHLAKPVAPYLAARLIQPGGPEALQPRVAVQTTEGWFVASFVGPEPLRVAVRGLALRNAGAGKPPQLLVRYLEMWLMALDSGGDRAEGRCTEKWVLCGFGAGGKPSCTPPFPTREGSCDDFDKVTEWDFTLDVDLATPGHMRIKPARGNQSVLTLPPQWVLGDHRIAFP